MITPTPLYISRTGALSSTSVYIFSKLIIAQVLAIMTVFAKQSDRDLGI
ncbi:hypothetical protein [Providencia sp. Me31A]